MSSTEIVKQHRLTKEQQQELIHDLAVGEKTQRELGEKYGVNQSNISLFKKAKAREIEKVQEEMTGFFTTLWMGELEERVTEYQRVYEQASKGRSVEHLKVRLQALKQMDELSGQIPPKTNIAIIPVQHMVIDAEGNNLIDVL